jgi:chromosome partitioning protein
MKRLLCFSGKGGCGKTHLSRHIAVAAALAGHRVVTVDFDPQKGLSHWWDRRPERLPKIVNMEAGWPDAAELMEMDGPYDLMVIDTPAYHGYADQPEHLKRLLKGAHLILIPARPTIDDADSAVPMMELVKRDGIPAAFVLNAVKPNVTILNIERRFNKAGSICPIRIADRWEFSRVAEEGMTVLDTPRTKKNDKAFEEILGVWDYAARRLEMNGHGT